MLSTHYEKSRIWASIFERNLESDCSKENLVITSNIEVFSIPIENLSPHPLAQLTYQTKSLFSLNMGNSISISMVDQSLNNCIQ